MPSQDSHHSSAAAPLLNTHYPAPHRPYRFFYLVAFLSNFTPSSPYLTTYLETTKDLDEDVINDKIWPTSTYAMLALTIPVAILSTKLPRHSLACGILCRLAAYLTLLFSEEGKVAPLVGVEVLYGAFIVIDSNVLVSTACLYANEDEFALAAVGIGVARELALVSSSLLGQALHDYTNYDIAFLFVISLCSCLGAFAVFLGTLAATQVKDWKFMEDTAGETLQGATILLYILL